MQRGELHLSSRKIKTSRLEIYLKPCLTPPGAKARLIQTLHGTAEAVPYKDLDVTATRTSPSLARDRDSLIAAIRSPPRAF
jgi:hypothetical protein